MNKWSTIALCLLFSSTQAAQVSVRLDQVLGGDDHGESPATLSGVLNGTYDTASGVVTMAAGTTSITFLSLSQPGNTLFTDLHTNWATGGSSYLADAYSCADGTFAAPASFCGNYWYGSNGIDQSSLDYSTMPGTRTLGGDDISTGVMRQGLLHFTTAMVLFDGTTLVMESPLWNNLGPGGSSTDGIQLSYSVVPLPAAAWLLGSALGLLGWTKRRRA